MNNVSNVEIDNWLLSQEAENDTTTDNDWDPGFDADRQVISSKIGPYNKMFLRPKKFVKRFYHKVYALPIEEWKCTEQIKLYDDFCMMDLTLNVRFQATFNYALSNMEILTELNGHIKEAYYGLVMDIAKKHLLNLSDGTWVQEGLESVENKICSAVSEMLILQKIQSQAVCTLKPSFEEFPDVQFAKESVYLCVLKKSFEFSDQQKEELFRQQQEEESQKIEHKRKQFKQLNISAELDRQRQTLHAENNKCFLEEKEQHQLEQFEIKKRIYADKVEHNSDLKKMDLKAEFEERDRYHKELMVNEESEKLDLITHQTRIKKIELEAEIEKFEREKEKWNEAKSKIHSDELEIKHLRKQLEFDTDVGYRKRYEIQRLAMQEESYAARKKSDIYLKREIELLELEKQRVALQLSIKDYKQKAKTED